VVPLLVTALAALLAGPGIALGVIGIDALLLGWKETRRRLRDDVKVPVIMSGVPPFLAAIGTVFGFLADRSDISLAVVMGFFAMSCGLLVSSGLGLKSLASSIAWWRHRRLVKRLRDPKSREAQITRLKDDVEHHRQSASHGRVLLLAIDALTRASRWDEVVEVIDGANREKLGPVAQRLLCVYRSLAALHHGDAPGARTALDASVGPLQDLKLERWRAVLDAVLSALEGRPDRTRALVQSLDPRTYRLEREVALAHALVAEGKELEARDQVLKVRVELDEDLDAMFLVPGPATPIAKALRTGNDSPFR
jgi:hypothetical protein